MNHKLGQYFNFSSIRLVIKHYFYNRVQADYEFDSISNISTDFITENSIKLILIDKDNTITAPYEDTFYNYNIEKKVREFQQQIGYNKVILVSNSIGSSDDSNDSNKDIKITQINTEYPIIRTYKELDILTLVHGKKKPNINFTECFDSLYLKKMLKYKIKKNKEDLNKINIKENNDIDTIYNNEVLVIGDRKMIDIVMAKDNQFKSALVNPLDTKKENIMVSLMRLIEKYY